MKETGSITFQSTAEAFDGKTFSSSKVLLEHEKEEQEKQETLDMASGDQVILPESGKVLSKVTIEKPDTMIPENILKDIDIGGVIGTASGGGGIEGGYNVTFNANGTDYSIISIADGNAIREPVPPTLSGKVVIGWSTDSAGENLVTFPYTPTADITLYAKLSGAYTVLNDNTWETISAISAAGTGANYWSVGDTKTITLNGTVGGIAINQSFKVYILGFNHNSAREGTGIAFGGFRNMDATNKELCLVDGYYGNYSASPTSYTMNPAANSSASTNAGGWKKAKIRKNILGSTDVENGDATPAAKMNPVANSLMAALPSDLRTVLKPVTKYTDNVGNASTAASAITSTVDYLPLMAEFEVFGARKYANDNERTYQARYSYYANGNSKVRYKHNNDTSAAFWWLRSPYSSNATDFCRVNTSGSASSSYSGYSCGLAPAFLV